MAKKLTAKAPLFGNKRSHSCRATRHKQNVNLQKLTYSETCYMMNLSTG